MTTEPGLSRMADILMPQSPATPLWPVWAAVLLVLLLLLLALWRWRRTPKARLLRLRAALDSSGLNARQAAHRLALDFGEDLEDRADLERLRFAPDEPDVARVRALIERRLSEIGRP